MVPYRSPKTGGGKGAGVAVDIFTATSSFEVGDLERHEVRITWSLWSGEEIYEVNDIEVLRMWNFDFSRVRKLEFGNEEKHTVEVCFRSFPFNIVQVTSTASAASQSVSATEPAYLDHGCSDWAPTGLFVAWFLHFRG
jgi:hypothetical protein